MASKLAAGFFYVLHYISVVQLNGCLMADRCLSFYFKQVIFHNNLIGKEHNNLYDTQSDTHSRL